MDLNIDLGELPDEPEELYALANRVNVACGGHAGDRDSMTKACRLARAAGALVGAHPSYEDRAGFGRRSIAMPPELLRSSIELQCRALMEIAGRVSHLKPHGALYHDANRDPDLALVIVDVAFSHQLALIGPPEGELRRAAQAKGLRYLAEGFADRRYLADGTLAPRTSPGALIDAPESAARQATELVASGRFETICIHSDTPGSVAIARAVRKALDAL